MDEKPTVDEALRQIEDADTDEEARTIEMQFVKQTDNQGTEDAVFGDANGEAAQ